MNKLLNVQETSEILGVKVQTLYNMISEQRITFVKIGRLVKFDEKDLIKFIDKNKHYKRSF